MTNRYPSLDHLRTFAIAARHLSFKKAAAELHVTPAAVGQRIKLLEEQIQTLLFRRETRAIYLTKEGQGLAISVQNALDHIDRGLAKITTLQDTNSLTISTTPVFAERWLLNKLPLFKRSYEEISVRVIADESIVDLQKGAIDLAIRFGRGDYHACDSTKLVDDAYLPVCHPKLAGKISDLACLKNVPLISCDWGTQRGSAPTWQQWIENFTPLNFNLESGLSVSLESLAIQAALTNQGIALVHKLHVESELESGELVAPFGAESILVPEFSYYLVEAKNTLRSACAERFKQWLFSLGFTDHGLSINY